LAVRGAWEDIEVLALVEQYLDRVRRSRSDADVLDILTDVSASMGFRSAYLVEYANALKLAAHVLDTNPERGRWWSEYMTSGFRTNTAEIASMLAKGGVQRFRSERFSDPRDPMLTFSRKYDMMECALVPISHDGVPVGVLGFSGEPDLSDNQQMALQIISYSLFTQTRSFRSVGVIMAPAQLTPREKEVMRLSADGLTSQEIADRLGMSARTVNQHVDNVSDKLGTKNRAHTVAEVIRHNLLA
jgi:LuxR family quorum sensing-dependent transcriptional regulator